MVLVGEPGFVSSQPGFDPPQQGQNTENQGVSYTELTVPSRCMVRGPCTSPFDYGHRPSLVGVKPV